MVEIWVKAVHSTIGTKIEFRTTGKDRFHSKEIGLFSARNRPRKMRSVACIVCHINAKDNGQDDNNTGEGPMAGVIFSIIAGMAMSIQGVMNTRLSEKIGLYESNVFVQGTAFLLSLVAVMIMGKNGFGALWQTDKIYLLGGVLGLVITITVMLGIKGLSPTIAISIILISQLLVAALIDALGLLGADKIHFGWTKYVGMVLMLGGLVLFKLKK